MNGLYSSMMAWWSQHPTEMTNWSCCVSGGVFVWGIKRCELIELVPFPRTGGVTHRPPIVICFGQNELDVSLNAMYRDRGKGNSSPIKTRRRRSLGNGEWDCTSGRILGTME
jgi:hypothetical protein